MKFLFFWRAKPVAREYELAPGVPKPTTILANLIAADLMSKGVSIYQVRKSGEDVLFLEEEAQANPYSSTRRYRLQGKHYKIRASDTMRTGINFVNVYVDGVDFSHEERSLILEALKKGMAFEEEKLKVKTDAKSQQAAVTAIEKFMGLGKLAKNDCKDCDCDGQCVKFEDSLKPLPGPSVDDFFSLNAGRR